MIDHVLIVGAGFSGSLQAINLLRHDGPRATLIERSGTPGKGLAYGAAHASHVLNVRAGNMSALPDDPGHFVRWLEARGVADAPTAFIPRLTYGEYLREQLAAAQAAAPERLTIVRGDVTGLHHDGRAVATLADGQTLTADAAVLAVGNLPPHTPPALDPKKLGARYFGDPWAPGVADGLSDDDTVLIIGTGLTMIDVALLLEAKGFRGRIVALSRRGLLPRPHVAPGGAWKRIDERPKLAASRLLNCVRARGHAIDWRNAVDELRPFTQDMWANASEDERARFLRHLRPWWDVHRHRLAPEVYARLTAMIERGQLVVRGGKPSAFEPTDAGVRMHWRPRGADVTETLDVTRIVNAIGPQGDLTRTQDPLLASLHARGLIRPDAAHLGIDVDPDAATIGADGRTSDWLYALGPMTRGAFWEIVAVPDIRTQTWSLARKLSNAHWVGGEGL
ncbi:FAD/NAD(P)-binding protein [Sphingomonas donggukensis]|uniref:FAD/NAD(P)-binding protein n=1 Tax=Sphingomonas donggukensis TaxID=2949093 RepID=A0ABY4TWZ0_9SPHN|nr:FAD/NAD(P)-binding protein [Sphingomonas donggukensis]URW76863.1 FAD/NAD(P)-binding protein [Sphingomonas donggukensis]